MKKLVLVLGLATLFSCEKEEVSKKNCGCNKVTSIDRLSSKYEVKGIYGNQISVGSKIGVRIITQNECSNEVRIKDTVYWEDQLDRISKVGTCYSKY
jgi:hypothetical protein